MAVAQKVQVELKLPSPVTKEASFLFVKKLTGVAISHVAYARNLFNEEDFCDKTFDGVSIKVIRGMNTNSDGARCLSNWLQGAFDAIQHGYLRALYLEIIQKHDDGKERLLETYSFLYSYDNGEAKCSIEDSSQVIGQTRDEVRNLLRNILVMTSTLDNLPANCFTSIKLAYYDEVTPQDYEPPNFKSFYGQPAQFDCKTIKYNCRQVKTPFHSLMIKIKSVEKSKQVTSPSVNCLCKVNDTGTSKLECEECLNFQHPACYKMLVCEEGIKKHTCAQCSKLIITPDFEPENCIFRRVLAECAKSKSVSLRSLRKAIAIDAETTLMHMRRLQREGALPKILAEPFSVEKPDYTYNVQKSKMKDLKKKYFS